MDNKGFINLDMAMERLQADIGEDASPCFFFIGAGVSAPEVPCAEDMADRILKKTGRTDADPDRRDLRFTKIAGDGEEAQRARLALIEQGEQADPSQANQLLARVLLAGRLGRLAVTNNFDTGLVRAVRAFGEPVRLCEGVCGAPAQEEVTVVHLQGAGQAWSLAGLASAGVEPGVDEAMQEEDEREIWLRSLLSARIGLVLGFSGREDDAFMRALKRSLAQDDTDRPVYWFLHRADEYHALPAWVREHPRVVFVARRPPASIRRLPLSSGEYEELLDVRDADVLPVHRSDALDAAGVLQALIARFRLPLPDLVGRPERFLARQQQGLEPCLHSPESLLLKRKMDGFSVVENTADPLVASREALLSFDPARALDALEKVDASALDERIGEEYFRACILTAKGLLRDRAASERLVGLLDTALASVGKRPGAGPRRQWMELALLAGLSDMERGETATAKERLLRVSLAAGKEQKPTGEVARLADLAGVYAYLCAPGTSQAVFSLPQHRHLGLLLRAFRPEPQRAEEGIVEALKAHGDHPDVGFVRVLLLFDAAQCEAAAQEAQALLESLAPGAANMHRSAILLYIMASCAERRTSGYPLKDWNRLINRFEQAFDQRIRRIRAAALCRKAAHLRSTGSYVEAIKVLGSALQDYESDGDMPIERVMVRCALDKAMIKQELGWTKEADTDLADLLSRYGEFDDPHVRKQVAQARFALARLALTAEEPDRAKELFRDLLTRYRTDREELFRTFCASAMLELARIARRRKEYRESLSTLDELLSTYGHDAARGAERVLAEAYLLSCEIYLENRYLQEAIDRAQEGIARLQKSDHTDVAARVPQLVLSLLDALLLHQDYRRGVEQASAYLDAPPQGADVYTATILLRRADFLHRLGENEDALRDYDRYVVRFGNEDRREDMIHALSRRALIQRQLGQNLNAQRSLDQVIQIAVAHEAETHAELIATSYLDKARMHLEDEQYERQREVLEAMLEQFADGGRASAPYRIQARYELAKNNLYARDEQGALEMLATVFDIPVDEPSQQILETYARAAKMQVEILTRTERYQEAREAVESALPHLLPPPSEEARRQLVGLLLESMKASERLDDDQAVVQTSDRAIGLLEDARDDRMHETHAAIRKARMQAAYRLRDASLLRAGYEELMEQGRKEDESIHRQRVDATLLYGDYLLETGAHKDAIDVYMRGEKEASRLKATESNIARSTLQYRLARTYAGIGSTKRARKTCEEILSRFGRENDPRIRENVQRARLDLAADSIAKRSGLFGARRLKKAHRLYDQILAGAEPDVPELIRLRVRALYGKGRLHLLQGKKELAARTLRALHESYEQHEDPYVRSLVEQAREDLDEMAL